MSGYVCRALLYIIFLVQEHGKTKILMLGCAWYNSYTSVKQDAWLCKVILLIPNQHRLQCKYTNKTI